MFSIVARRAFLVRPWRPQARECAGRAPGASPSTRSVHAAPSAQSAAAAIQTPFGESARPSAAESGPEREADVPREGVQRHVPAHEPRLGEIGGERAGDGAVQALADREDDHDDDEDREAPSRRSPRRRTARASQAPAHRSPNSASVGIRRRPRASRAIGSCVKTMTSVLTRNRSPIWVSSRPASFFAYTGSTSNPEKPAKMKSAFSAMTATNGRWRSTSR